MRNSILFLLIIGLVAFQACQDDDEKKFNQAPDTSFSVEEINLTGENRLNSIVRLSWYGTDPDGYVKGFELSTDGENWTQTQTQDSTFRFSISSGSDTANIQIFVRSIDNEDAVDPTPDELIIPIRNTPPVISFSEDLTIPDTAHLVATTEWNATDIDGSSTITQVFISLNGKAWYEVNKTKKIFSIVPVDPLATDTTNAYVYYSTDGNPSATQIEGLVLNDTNRIFIKAVDQAGAESMLDTTSTFFMRGKTNDILVIGGMIKNAIPRNDANIIYKTTLDNINVDYDFIDMVAFNGLYRPKLWNITFKLQLSFYDKLFFYSNETQYTNPYSNVTSLLLEFAASSLQSYANNGGKFFISTFFTYQTNIDGFIGVLPIASKPDTSYANAFMEKDSGIVARVANYPDLLATNPILTNVGVYNIDSSDTEVLYEARVNYVITSPWPDTKTIASGRRRNGKLNQVFFNIELWRMKDDQAQLDNLFNQILNVEFN